MSLKIGWFAGQSDCDGPLAEEIRCVWDKHLSENTLEERNGSEQDEKILFGHGRTLKIKVLSIFTIYVQMFFYKFVCIFNKSIGAIKMQMSVWKTSGLKSGHKRN